MTCKPTAVRMGLGITEGRGAWWSTSPSYLDAGFPLLNALVRFQAWAWTQCPWGHDGSGLRATPWHRRTFCIPSCNPTEVLRWAQLSTSEVWREGERCPSHAACVWQSCAWDLPRLSVSSCVHNQDAVPAAHSCSAPSAAQESSPHQGHW